ncbi:MAG: ATP synthase F1 subunit epsilon [Eubacterium sp.]|nr:ATP synthase F1 subunit epsilon [Eubacterium sp.]
MLHNLFKVRIYEADSPFYEGEMESLVVPTIDGEYGIQARHRNLVIAIVPGIMKYRLPNEEMKTASVSEGMVRIEDGDVLVLVNTAERPEEIDAERAKARIEEAREIMLQKRSLQEYYSAEATLRRSMVRLRAFRDQSIN